MTTLPDRPNTALMVLDMQKGVVAEAHQRDAVVSNIAALVDRAREAGVVASYAVKAGWSGVVFAVLLVLGIVLVATTPRLGASAMT